MGAAWMLHHWARRVRSLVPQLHGHQIKTLALMALSMCCSGQCRVTTMALAAPAAARRASVRRRFERFLANDRVDVAGSAVHLGRAIVRQLRGGTLTLMLDETSMGPWLNCMKVSVGYRGRALPLAWACYAPGRLPIPQPQIVELVLRQAALCLPANTSVVLMADRGLSWPSVIDLCHELGWHYLLRVQGQTTVRVHDWPTQRADTLVHRGGPACCASAEVFRSAGWRACNIVAIWPSTEHEPWLLITDLPPRQSRCAEYRRRMWQEESFRDEKSHGFGWHTSRVREPDHADRLLLVMQLAMWMVIAAGTALMRRGVRTLVECTWASSLSVFQLGYRWWRYIVPTHYLGRAPPITLALIPQSVG